MWLFFFIVFMAVLVYVIYYTFKNKRDRGL